MANEPNHATRVLAALEGIRAEMAEIRSTLDSFTQEGLPMRAQLPTSELASSLTASLVVLLRDKPLNSTEIQQRVMAAQVIAQSLIEEHDRFRTATQAQRLDNLAQM
jgi:hypothetical protein